MGSKVGAGSRTAFAVYGAAGHTGRFVVAELMRRDILPIAVGRDAIKLAGAGFPMQGVECRQASVEDAVSLARALDGAAAVINCAGPFVDTGAAIASAALRAGIHYLDVSAEQASTHALFDRFDWDARQAGIAVMPAMGFYGGLADLLASAAMGDWMSADAIEIGIGLDSWHPTEGTRITGRKNIAPRMIIADGQLAPMEAPTRETHWTFDARLSRQSMVELPFSEVVLIARHLRIRTLRTYLSSVALRDIRDPATPVPVAIDESGRSAQRFAVEAIVRRNGETRRASAQGQDIYASSAPLICEAAQRLAEGRFASAGVQAPGAIFDADDFLSALAPEHLSFATFGS